MRLTPKNLVKLAKLNSIQAIIWNPRNSNFHLFDADSQQEKKCWSHAQFSALYSHISRSHINM